MFTLLLMKKNRRHEAVRKLLDFIYLTMEFEGTIRTYGTNVDIHGSEIYLMKNIADHEASHISELARILGVSKSAVSQMVFRLKKKGLAYKETDPENRTRYLVKLTEKGKAAHARHMRLRHEIFTTFLDDLEMFNDDEVEQFTGFIDRIRKFF
jgi:DNA-binding MarR family transcriptional regulator